MSINVYEILDRFKHCDTEQQRKDCLIQYSTNYFKCYLKYCFDPNIEFYYNDFPENYIKPLNSGAIYANIESELYRTYLFIKGDVTADSLTDKKRNQLFVNILESFLPEEALVYVNMMKKNINVPHLTKELVQEIFPGLIADAN